MSIFERERTEVTAVTSGAGAHPFGANGAAPAGATIGPAAKDDERGDDPGVGRRLLRPQTIVSFGLALAIVVFLVSRLEINLSTVWANVRNANLLLYGLALAVYYATFALRAVRWRAMLEQAGIDGSNGVTLPRYPRLVEMLLLSWFVNCVIPAKIGDAYRCYLLKRDTGASFSATLGTILAERLTDLVVLFFTMTVAGIIAFHGDLPSQVTKTMIGGIALVGVGIAVVAAMGFARERVQRLVPQRFHEQFGMLHDAIFACLRSPWRPVGISAVIWSADGFRLFLVAASLGAGLSFPLTLFVALMSALLTTLPITPAGLGVVEAAVIVVLKLVDVDPSMAISIAFLDRLIGYWSLILVGLVLYVRRLRTDVRGTDIATAR
jgi:uncharacterized membrane protein YbhN (UPF0104 family)